MKLVKMNSRWIWRLFLVAATIILTCSNTLALSNSIGSDDIEFIGPLIIPSLNEIVLRKGQNYTIYCKSNVSVEIRQQELSEEISTESFSMVQRNVISSDDAHEFETALDLYNVDQFAVGYYACFDNTVNPSHILNNFMEEPTNTEHVSYIYIYVDETDSLFAPMREVVILRSGSKVVIECRPTTPDVNVTLTGDFADSEYQQYSFNPKIGFTFDSDVLLDDPINVFTCIFVRQNSEDQSIDVFVNKYSNNEPPTPKIASNSKFFLEGETFSLNCTVTYLVNVPVVLSWKTPRLFPQDNILNTTNEQEVIGGVLYNNITIVNATAEDAGTYKCISKNINDYREASYIKTYKGKTGFITLTKGRNDPIIETQQAVISLRTNIFDYPPANIVILHNNKELPSNTEKYIIKKMSGSVYFTIRNSSIYDAGNYTIVATNKDVTANVTYDVRPKVAPAIDFGSKNDRRFLYNTMATLTCTAIGYPTPKVKWIFTNKMGDEQTLSADDSKSLTKVISYLKLRVHASGNISCQATNEMGKNAETRRFLVNEVPGGFGVTDSDQMWFSEDQQVIMRCYASRYDFTKVSWFRNNGENMTSLVKIIDTPFSYIAQLQINEITLNDAGNYTCIAETKDGNEEMQNVDVIVAAKQLPVIILPNKETDQEVNPYQPVELSCQANAVPPPIITWYKDGELIQNNTNIDIYSQYINRTTINSTVDISQMLEENKGKYECEVKSGTETKSEFYNLIIKEKSPFKSSIYLSIVGIVGFFLVLLIVYLIWKIRRDKRKYRKELEAAGLLYFNEGVTRSLNPDLGIDEQAELLPYDKRFEFPPEKLTLGTQLGAGAFGVVYKAEARGIINAEENTTVAVKMVKKTADNMYIKALASELKIMVHLGKHVNIVNLLGACTQNVVKRELIIIVEYCKFGNIHNYMQRHREVFIDQLTDNKEKNLGKVNRAYSASTGSSCGMQYADYFGSNQTQETDHTFVNTANTNRSGRKDNANQQVELVGVSETGYVQPEWRSNYESDYSFDGRAPRPLTSRDLLAWAFQIARGMEYLANRKVLHGDLAARNVLLAEDNIVKICDFGLARSIYRNDEYKKQENSPLPVKWLAIECMTDRIFSTQSDVWSFGIVLWELFSLAKTPYPNVSPTNLVEWLSDGHRLDKPQYADDKLYDVMRRCWEQKPTARPNFGQLQEILGSFLEDNVRNHYVDLNSPYMESNIRTEGQEDYLAMVCTPDYNNLVTPPPHHYVNDARSFFPPTPTQLQHDDEGYLQMSPANQIFSPRIPSTKFDFDARKLNPRVTEPYIQGSELTPMLTLNNLPARSGSESDHDGNISPYLNMCPRIEEETDDVFETKQYNFRNAQHTQNSAVSNPTYVTFDVDLEKKPQNISNNYINVPNGLVK